MLYLRARHYAPSMGRFLTKDTWEGYVTNPITFNRWQYADANPITYTDPSGHLACKDIIPSWRPIFEALRLCDPNEPPTLNQETVDNYQAINNWVNGNSVICGAGYTSYGFICVPVIVRDNQCEDSGLIPSVPSQWPVPSQTCQQLEASHRLAMMQLAALDLRRDALFDKLRDTHEPTKVKEIMRQLKRLEEDRNKIVAVLRILKKDAMAKGCPTADDWPDPSPY